MSLNCSDCPHSILLHVVGPEAKCKECDCKLVKVSPRKIVSKSVPNTEKHLYVPGMGNPTARLMIVGEAPGKREEDELKPFVGPSGQLLDEFLLKAGLSRDQVYVTNVVKIRPPNNEIKRLKEFGKEISDFIPQLRDEIKAINPNAILAVGGTALEALTGNTGILKWRGSILRCQFDPTRKVIPSIHPANLLPNSPSMLPYSTRAFVQLDFNRAVEESKHSRYEVPERSLIVCKGADHLQNFLKTYNEGIYAVDIETYKSVPSCIALAPNRHTAMSIPLVRQKSKYDAVTLPDYEIEEIWRIVGEVLANPSNKILGQNFKFDQERLLNTCHIQVGNFYADTLLMSHTLQPEFPKGLYFLTSIYTREPYYKDEGREFNPSKDKLERLFLYNAKDAAVTFEVFEVLREELLEAGLLDFYFNHVHPQHNLYFDLEDKGFAFNEKRRQELQTIYTEKATATQEFLDNLAGHKVNVNSPIQVKRLLFEELSYPTRKDASEDTLVALLSNHSKGDPDKDRIIPTILDLRRIKKTIGTYLNSTTDYDGRMRSGYRIVGTENGRSSSTKYGPPTRPENIGIAAQTVTEHGDFGVEFQECFIADPGTVLLSMDFSQAEPRVVAILSNDDELLEDFRLGKDVHSKTASWFFGIPTEAIGKKSPERIVGKMGRNAGNYDVKKRTLMTGIMTDARRYHIDIFISEYKAGQILDIFHNKTPKVRGVFHEDVKRAIRDTRTLINPFGRRRQFFDRWGEDLFKEAYACIPQGTVKDKLAITMLAIKAKRPDTQFLRESHDAFVLQCRIEDEKEYRELIQEETKKPINFEKCSLKRGELVIPIEIKTGFNLGMMK
jgi:uracil-DNA glycosylase family 4